MSVHGEDGGATGEGTPVVARVPARVGLVGNPSDGYGGAVLATVVPVLAAEVTAAPMEGVRLVGGGSDDRWPTLDAWRRHVGSHGHGELQRIVSAPLAVLLDHLVHLGRHPQSGGSVRCDGVEIRWGTSIPRSVGLAGSSALAVGVIRAAATAWRVQLDPRVVAALALAAERDVLGITAGWQDRIVQAMGRTVLVDAAHLDEVDGVSVPRVATPTRPVTPASSAPSAHETSGLELVLGWSTEAGSSSADYHAPLRRSADALAAPMAELAALARGAADAWAAGDVAAVAAAVDAGWRVRQAHAPLRDDHAALVEAVRAAGVSATTPGSGGAVVAVAADRQEAGRAVIALRERGCSVLRWTAR